MGTAFPLIFLLIFVFQNCAPFYANDESSIYSFRSPPDFYYDIKLAEVSVDSSLRESYRFDVAISFAHDPNLPVNYQLNYSTALLNPVCPASQGTAHQATKHLSLSCIIPTSDDLYVELILVGPNGETVTDRFRF